VVADVSEDEPATRFWLLETIRQYAREKLEDFGETGEISGRHARFFAALAGEAETHLRGGAKNLEWLQRRTRAR
jgi:predicted ATPase